MTQSIDYSALDFQTVKDALISYLQEQEVFQDYDFTGSNFNVLLDILAYNTFNSAFYTNMVAQEMFLSTAQLRDSVVSHAKELGYLPRSSRSAKATVTLTFNTGGANTFVIPKYTQFTGTTGAENFVFTTNTALTVSTTSNTAVATLDCWEGEVVSDSFIFRPGVGGAADDRMVLTNPSVDVSSLEVVVIEDSGSTTTEYRQVASLFDLDDTSAVFFVQPAESGRFEILFGDGVVGRRPAAGAIVTVTYRATAGANGNGIQRLQAAGLIAGFQPTVATAAKSAGGAFAEGLESIRFNAPRHFSTQERAVTAGDYQTLLLRQFPELTSVSVYGGEEVTPPQYGRVFVAANIDGIIGLPESKKIEYTNFLKQRTPLTIQPVFVLPEYMFVAVESLVRYNINLTAADTAFIRSVAINAINNYADTNLNDFKSTLRYSRLVRDIDNSDRAIISNETALQVYKTAAISPGVAQDVDIVFDLAVEPGSLVSTAFVYNGLRCVIRDSNGRLQVVRDVAGLNEVVVTNIGSVDYATGQVHVSGITIQSVPANTLRIYVTPASADIISARNVILTIVPEDITINVEGIRE